MNTIRLVFAIAMLTCCLQAQVKLEADPATTPSFTQAKVETRTAPDLAAAIDAASKQPGQPLWVGYAEPLINRPRFICCFDTVEQFRSMKGCCSGCKLEGKQGSYFDSNGGTCVNRVPPTHFFVMIRLADGGVSRIRTFTPDCGLDAGGKTVVWLTGVTSGQSIAYLERLAKTNSRRLAEDAISAIGLHADPLADQTLERFVAAQQSESMREHAAFWLGSQRGRAGYEFILNLLRTDTDPKFRENAIFVVSESDQADAIPEIIRIAKTDRDSSVRGQALFWLAQTASRQAEVAITDAMERDPDAEVKRKAVFALSQLPTEQGVPLLIKYARATNPVVRKEAIFWLGQSEDSRALDFLEKFLLEKN
jgi:hypothetical protein